MVYLSLVFFFFKQKTAYEMRISDWSSDVCSSDLLAAFGGVQRDHVVARRDAGDALADLDHHARALVAEHHRKQALGVRARQRERIGVAQRGVGDLHQHLDPARRLDVDLDDMQRMVDRQSTRRNSSHYFASRMPT